MRRFRPLRRAIELNPSLIEAYNWLQISLMVLGRDEESLEVLQQALAIDPLNHTLNSQLRGQTAQPTVSSTLRANTISQVIEFPDVPGYTYDWIWQTSRLSAGNFERSLHWIKLGGEHGGLAPGTLSAGTRTTLHRGLLCAAWHVR